jgi:hypothetical protein
MNENANIMDTNWAAADAALAVWLEMWNTDSEIARRICSEDFRAIGNACRCGCLGP